ncbi:MAG: DUF2855 family protein [Pseudomonadota bacterium]
MSLHWNLLIEKDQIHKTSLSTESATELKSGQVEVQLETFALTANNITYAVLGNSLGGLAKMGYWDFFPYDEKHGLLPVWGYSRVVQSQHDDLAEDTLLYGFFPLGSHLVMEPKIQPGVGVVDAIEHRRSLPGVYNQYTPTASIRNFDSEESLWPVFRPLYVTGFMISDELVQNQCFGASQVVVGSSSSKTAMLFAHCFKQAAPDVRLVGLTSSRNVSFVNDTRLYDDVVGYDNFSALDDGTDTVFVDMAGNGDIIKSVYQALGTALKAGILVGKSHWSSDLDMTGLEGPKMNMFFAPEVIRQRMETWGPKVLGQKLAEAWESFVVRADQLTTIWEVSGPEGAQGTYMELIKGNVDPSVSNLVRV